MFTERRLLQLKIVFLIEVVQPGFTQCHHLLCCRQTAQLSVVVAPLQIERMHPAGEGHVIALANQLRHRLIARQSGGHRQHVTDIARLGLRQGIIHILMQSLVIQAVEVTMRIY
ncbi:hypothetical protein D3C80_1220200 [compost metagenome]